MLLKIETLFVCAMRRNKKKNVQYVINFFYKISEISKYDFFIETERERERVCVCFFLSFLNIHQQINENEIIDF